MAEDEAGTVRAITAYRQEIALLVQQSGGRVVDATGDNVLAEFPTASGAVQCALEIQRVLAARNEALPRDGRLQFRIGVHLGEVHVQEGRIYGDGVNIAARLESLAEPGGVCVSRAVRDQGRAQHELHFEDLGERALKNIAEPVHVFRVRSARPGESRAPALRAPARRRRLALVSTALAVAALLGVGLWSLAAHRAGIARPNPSAFTVSGFGDRPAVAVLPFDNLSPDPTEEYFADGLAEDLITRLALWRSFPVIARNSSFAYKGKPVDLRQVSADLGVRYVVEGSVRRSGDRVRVSAQLIDATTGEHVWADTYDREIADVFALQDEISTAIAAPLVGDLERAEQARALQQDPHSLEAWGLYQRATRAVGEASREANAEAETLLERALALDPGFASAWGRLAVVHAMRLIWGWTDERETTGEAALRAARMAVELDPGNPLAQGSLGMASALVGDGHTALDASRRAVELNPSMPEALDGLGFALAFIEASPEGIEVIERAVRLGPRDPLLWLYLDNLAGAYFLFGRYDEGLETGKRVVAARPKYYWGYLDLAMNHAGLGQLEEARAAVREARAVDPGLSLEAIRRSGASPANVERMSAALRQAGLPE